MIAHLRTQQEFAIDTEADSLHSYFDKVCLIQITAAGEDYIVDPLAKIDIAALGEVLAAPEIRKVLHGADYDLRILNRDFGFTISNLFDTMVSAQFLGYEGVGLAALLKRHFNVDVDKSFQRADWAMRPLTPQMLKYAALDTQYLSRLAAILEEELLQLGRKAWALEEFERLTMIRFRETEIDPEAFRKVKGIAVLDPRGLAIFAALFRYRDTEARRIDRPPFKVLRNEVMIEMAGVAPQTREQLLTVRGLSPGQVSRSGDEILRAVRSALELPDDALPGRTPQKAWNRDREVERRVEKMKAVRDRLAKELKLEASMLAPRHVLTAIASIDPPDLSQVPAMREWQKTVAGDAFLEAISEGTKKQEKQPGLFD